MVFHEVDEALRALVRADVAGAEQVEVVFDAPTKEWSARRNAPTINLYLYDIREDLRRRERGLVNDVRRAGHGRRAAARRRGTSRLSYLITAWTQRPEDEHRLLSSLLYGFLRHETIPQELLTGPLAEIGLPVTMSVALPPPEDRSFADVWSALGGELKPSLDLVVTAPVRRRTAVRPSDRRCRGRRSRVGVSDEGPRRTRPRRRQPADPRADRG